MNRTYIAIVLTCLLTAPTALAAQDGEADIEGGVTEAGSVEMGMEGSADSSGEASASSNLSSSDGGSFASSGGGGGGGVRLGAQARLDAINVLDAADDTLGGIDVDGRRLLVPLLTPGVRLVDDRLFLGLGLGFQNVSVEDGPNSVSRSGFSFSPGASYDIIADGAGALSLGGFLNIAMLGETEDCDPDCSSANDDATGIGLTLLAGLRGKISPALAIGADFGWGFLSISEDSGSDIFVHGVVGAILFEASVGL